MKVGIVRLLVKEIFLAMDHPHVASLVDVYESDEQLFLVMDT